VVKREFLEEALQEISDEHIEEAAVPGVRQAEKIAGDARKSVNEQKSGKGIIKKLVKGKRWKPIVALSTAAAVIAVVVFSGKWWGIGTKSGYSPVLKAHAIGEASYPEMAPYPDESKYILTGGIFDDIGFGKVYEEWRADQKARRNQPEGYQIGADQFAARTIPTFLKGAGAENVVYSPLNVYMALSMAAEITDGETRGQLLDLLGAEDIETLRWKANAIWNAHYCDDNATASVLAGSLWLDDSVSYKEETVKLLAENYYASSYRGDMQTAEMGEALQAWLNQQTGGLLKDSVEGAAFDPETVLALATTVYFREKWNDDFSKEVTREDIFHGAAGDVTTEFMYTSPEQNYYWADRFGAISKSLDNGDTMWFVLPDEGVSVDEVLAEEQFTAFLEKRDGWENAKRVIIHFYLPKFDISSDLELTEGLRTLGITDIFTSGVADFTPISEDMPLGFISEISHAARVAVDEEGVTAAAYTVMMEAGAAPPPDEEIEFKLDRPFIFAITGRSGLPLFVGVVNQP